VSINFKKDLTGIILAGGKSTRPGFNKIEVKIGNVPLFIDQIFKLCFFCNEILISTSENNYEFINREIKKIKKYYIDYYSFCNLDKIPAVKIIMDKVRPTQDNSDGNNVSIGPVSGIKSGLEYAKNPYSLVVAFDMPFITYKYFYLLIDIKNSQSKLKDAFIIKTEKGYESLCGIYSKNCLNVISKNIENKKYKISEIFQYSDTLIIKPVRAFTKWKPYNNGENDEINFYKLNNKKIDSLNFFNINTSDDYNYFNKIWNLQLRDFQISSNQKFSKQISLKNGDKSEYNQHISANIFCEKWKYFFYR